MSDQGFKPIRHDGKAALEAAMRRPGFREAWEVVTSAGTTPPDFPTGPPPGSAIRPGR